MIKGVWKVTTAPAIEPVTLAEAKLNAKVGAPGGTAEAITKANPGVVTVRNHGLATGDVCTWTAASGMVQLNTVTTTVTYVTVDTFSIGVDTTAYTASDGTESYSVYHPDDSIITSNIITAREQLEGDTNRAYINQTITLKLDKFPSNGIIELPRPPLSSVTSIKYWDSDGVQQTVTASDYVVDTTSEPGRIGLATGKSWPTPRGEIGDIEIIYVAGYGTAASDVPEGAKQAIKLLVGDLFEHRAIQIDHTSLAENNAYNAIVGRLRVSVYA